LTQEEWDSPRALLVAALMAQDDAGRIFISDRTRAGAGMIV